MAPRPLWLALSLALWGSTVTPAPAVAGSGGAPAELAAARATDYAGAVAAIAARRAQLAKIWAGGDRAAAVRRASDEIIAGVRELARRWTGTRWGLGAPQATAPGPGKINCGTFVGTVLRDAGFTVDVPVLQRQPSQLIIRSFVGPERMRRWSNASMARFVADVRKMGTGLYIIGLDFHVGLLVQTEGDLRFLHASYVTGTVVDEPAAAAPPIVASKYRVVGKLLDRANLRAWLEGRRIEVKGTW
jgi:hypothetical protein